MPFGQMEDEDALVLKLPDGRVIVDVGADVDTHVQLLVKQRSGRPAQAHRQPGRPHRHLALARRCAVGHSHLEDHLTRRLPPAIPLSLAAQSAQNQVVAVDVRPQRRQRLDASRPVLGSHHLAHQRSDGWLRVLVLPIVASLIVGERHFVSVEPKRVTRRRRTLTVDVPVQVPVVDHCVVPTACQPRAPLDLVICPASLADRLARLAQLLVVLELLPLLLCEFAPALDELHLGTRLLTRLKWLP
mmetsp:Transcript_34473/g.80754  ORF Transcript_34473/g.80754 Transcript_34473/m.80754 type:complete len:244 (+) Transcript_34473:357-1088(+)